MYIIFVASQGDIGDSDAMHDFRLEDGILVWQVSLRLEVGYRFGGLAKFPPSNPQGLCPRRWLNH
jgi:hypothetical protein